MNEEENLENEDIRYPAETHKLMSWAALRFIHRPPHRLASLVAASILTMIALLIILSIVIKVDHRIDTLGTIQSENGIAEISSPFHGFMLAPLKYPGSWIKSGETIALVQMENSPLKQEIKSTLNGQLLQYSVEKGARLEKSQTVALIQPKESNLIAALEVSPDEASQIKVGQSVYYEISGRSAKFFAQLQGKVMGVNMKLLHDKDKIEKIHYIVKASLVLSPEIVAASEHSQLLPGTDLRARIVIRQRRIISTLIESFFHAHESGLN